MELSDGAKKILQTRYVKKDEDGRPIETAEEVFVRVAKDIAKADEKFGGDVNKTEKEFYGLMENLDFLPNSPTLMNAGKELGQLSACFVLPIEDTMEDIFDTIKNAALIHKSGGGTGFSFSRIRPKGSCVRSTGGVASGPISFMKVFNAATEAVKQGGTRRGANMGILRVDHPDILEFISCKKNNADITNFNISVGITEKFMTAVINNENYSLIDPRTKKVVGELNAQEVYKTLVESAWRNGEPGIIFLDRVNRDNPVPSQGEIESTNPCGEQPLLPYEACNLGSINLAHMTKSTGKVKKIAGGYETDKVLDEVKLRKTVRSAVHFLDNVIERNKYPLPIIEKTTLSTRKIGLGVMGFADMLVDLGIAYASEEAIAMARKIMKTIRDEARKESIELAKIRGPFPLFEKSTFASGEPMRNATCTTIAPTGTLSMIAEVSSGIEPHYGIVEIKTVMDNVPFYKVNIPFKVYLESTGRNTEMIVAKVADNHGSIEDMEEFTDEIKEIFASAHDIAPIWHVKMQAAFQEFTDNAVSKTVNLKNSATLEDVDNVFALASQLGCKGVTIYRDGSRDTQVFTAGKKVEKPDEDEVDDTDDEKDTYIGPRKRPRELMGSTRKILIGCGKLYVTVNYDAEGVCEVLTVNGKGGGCPSQSEATARLASLALRSGISVNNVIDQLKGIRCPSTVNRNIDNGKTKILSCPDAIGKVIEYVDARLRSKAAAKDMKEIVEQKDISAKQAQDAGGFLGSKCPECGKPVRHENGCIICTQCGFSKCG